MRLLRGMIRLPLLVALLVPALGVFRPVSAAPQPGGGKESPFGIVANLANRVRSDEQPAMVGLMREAGVQWAREEISWAHLQPDRGGPYLWAGDGAGMYNYDQAIALQHTAGINVLGLLAYNPAWFQSKNPALDEWLGDWGTYVYNVVARYGRDQRQIRYWEVWNEANLRPFGYEHGLYTVREFVRILDVARAAIRAADPDAVIVLGGLYDIWGPLPTTEDYDSLDYLRMIHAAGGWNAFDVVALHPYRPAPPEAILHRRGPDMTLEQEFQALDAMLAEFGAKPVWLTEIGWSSFAGTFGVSEADQATYLQRTYVLALAHPSIQKVFWYDLREDTDPAVPYDQPVTPQSESEFHYGLLRRSFPLNPDAPDVRKPSFVAYRALVNALAGMRLEATYAEGSRPDLPGIFWYRFGDGVRHVDILWRLYGDAVDVAVPCACREARVRRWDGTLVKVTATGTGNVAGRLDEIGTPLLLEVGPDRIVDGTFFPETEHYLRGAFARYWQEQGGLAQFGYPITGELIEPDAQSGRARTVQYFERNRFDLFPEFANTAYAVQLGRLGELALQHQGVVWQSLPRRQAGDASCLFVATTGHQLCPPFRERWEQTGGLRRHGLPLTDAFEEGGRLVQYFERSRFEAHPENAAPFDVQLGLLSRELFASWGRWR